MYFLIQKSTTVDTKILKCVIIKLLIRLGDSMDVNHQGHRDRLRKRCSLSGFSSLSEYEKLELLLYSHIPRKNTNDIAHLLIDRFGSFAKVLDAKEADLLSVKGMTANAALFLSTLPDIVISYRESKANTNQFIHTEKHAVEYFNIHIGLRTTEVLQAICLNVKRQIIHTITIENHNSSCVNVDPGGLISEIIRHNAKHVIIGHNHPSGDVTPSREDIELTKNLYLALKILNIELVDSIIVSNDQSFSFRNTDMLKPSVSLDSGIAKVANTFIGWGKK